MRIQRGQLVDAAARFARPPNVIVKRDDISRAVSRHGVVLGHVLNVGSKGVRVGPDCMNLDIVESPGVDIVGDAHRLDQFFQPECFDTVVLNGVLQYCQNPSQVLEQVSRVLKPQGWLLLDAPFVQPYCADGADLWRFTSDGLRYLCTPFFDVLEVSTSIGTWSALAFATESAARTVSSNRIVGAALAWAVAATAWPLRFSANFDHRTAGAFLLIGRKRASGQTAI